jgi:hypothetical protein
VRCCLLSPRPSVTGSCGSDDFDEAHFDGPGIVKATDLQTRLAHLAPGEMLLLPAAEVDEAFHAYVTLGERRDAAVALEHQTQKWTHSCDLSDAPSLG